LDFGGEQLAKTTFSNVPINASFKDIPDTTFDIISKTEKN